MSKDAFWALIQEAKTACGQDLNAMEDYLREQLVSMGPAAAKNFHDILQTYEDLADQYGLWDAVSVIKEYGCSDDGFIDFRAWLIAQGKEVYMNALRDPDTLADIEPYGDCCFECLSYVGDYAYEQLTGRSAYDEMEPDRIEKLRDELKRISSTKTASNTPGSRRTCHGSYPGCARNTAGRSVSWRRHPHGITTSMRSAGCWTRARSRTWLPKRERGRRSVSEEYVIGVDHGYAAMKTVHGSFPSGLVAYEHEPYTQKNVLEYGGTYYVVGSGRQPLQKDKTRTEDYYLLTLAAIARELDCRNAERTCSVILAAGLPLTSFGRDKKKFRAYLLRDGKPVPFRYEAGTIPSPSGM